MAASKIAAVLLLFLCLIHEVVVPVTAGASLASDQGSKLFQARHLLGMDCSGACATRCSKASRAKICLFDCNACCKECNCVPSGTAGNREECPCYANLKNSKGTGKCP